MSKIIPDHGILQTGCVSVRADFLPAIKQAISANTGPIKVVGERGFGKAATVRHALHSLGFEWVIEDVGNKYSRGYFAGFSKLLFTILQWCEANNPCLIERHEHSLKRLFPFLESTSFKTPKDLTNIASDEERTRFYHYEYQNKLLHDVSSFLIEYFRELEAPLSLIISQGNLLPITTESFFNILSRRFSSCANKFILIILLEKPSVRIDASSDIQFLPCSLEEAMIQIVTALPNATDFEAEALWRASGGNADLLAALLCCCEEGVRMPGILSAHTMIDFYLLLKGDAYRKQLLEEFIAGDCEAADPIAMRNYDTCDVRLRDDLHRAAHERAVKAHAQIPYDLKLIHALSVSDREESVKLLCRPSKVIQNIGLYDTWMEFFSPYYGNVHLRRIGSGEDPCNAIFINAAFVLYSMGLGQLALPYLETFYETFPRSRYVPTALYAQSMTYGRYQIPVDLDRAEYYGTLNLSVIEDIFSAHEKYDYVKVFAENALAYIRARQGRLDEALRLCTAGNEKMLRIYGQRFKLHQSILIYNTGQIYELLHRYADAEQYYRLALDFDPFYGEYYNDLGNLFVKMAGREDDALSAYEKALSLCPSYYEAYFNRGLLHSRLGNGKAAEKDFLSVLDIKPEEYRAEYALGNLYLADGEPEEALKCFERARRNNNADPELFNNEALCRSELGDHDGAIALYKRAIAIKPDYADVFNNMAISCFDSGDAHSALRYIRKAVDLKADADFLATERIIAKSVSI
jgi:tetratricopeptide (TPR) repeat protein